MKRKRFYNNKRRGRKWSEKPVGRKIYFADKYSKENEGVHNTDIAGQKYKKPFFTRERVQKLLRGGIITVCSIFIVMLGYTVMDFHLERNAMPIEENSISDDTSLNNVAISVKGGECQPLSLDNGVMLSAVIDTAFDEGYSSLMFDLKRNDGTIGYNSALATVAAYGAQSSASNDLEGSVKKLKNNDIVPIGRISCYRDNIMASADISCAVFENGSLYKDKGGSAYLNPDAQGTYSYIKSIVEEASGLGVSVFILDNCDLPDGISQSFGDGFDVISKKLYSDFDNIKLYRAVSINLTSEKSGEIDEEFKKKTQSLGDDGGEYVLCITAKNKSAVKDYLNRNSITNYVICE